MGVRIKDVLDTIDEDDLYKMQMDLSKGGVHLKKLVEEKIKDNEASKSGFCVTCGENIGNKPESYTLIFGPEDFKKKALFCELDCLQYFLSGLKGGHRPEKRTVDEGGGQNAI